MYWTPPPWQTAAWGSWKSTWVPLLGRLLRGQLKLPIDGAFPGADFYNSPFYRTPTPCETSVMFQHHPVKEILWGSPLTSTSPLPPSPHREKWEVSPPPGPSLWVYFSRRWKETAISMCWNKTESFPCCLQNVIPVQVEMMIILIIVTW